MDYQPIRGRSEGDLNQDNQNESDRSPHRAMGLDTISSLTLLSSMHLARSMLRAPIGKLLMINDRMVLCCCQRLLTQYNAEVFVCKDSRLSLPDMDMSLDTCPYCGSRNILLYDAEGPREDPRTCRNDLEEYIESTTGRMNGVRSIGNEHLAETGGVVDSTASGMGFMYHNIKMKVDMVKDALNILDEYLSR